MDKVIALSVGDFTTLTAHHALQMRRLIGAPDAPVIASTGSKAMMLVAMQAAEIDLLTTLSLIPSEERLTHPVCGFWTLHGLAGHLADWDVYFLNWLGVLRSDEPQTLYWDEDGDAFNHWLWQRRQGEAWEKTWRDFRTNRKVLFDSFAQVSADEFMRDQPPNAHISYPTIYHCAWSALEHYLDHAAGVRRQLGLALPEELLHFQGPYT
jgi:hypothetical protein